MYKNMKLAKSLFIIIILYYPVISYAENLWVQSKEGIWEPDKLVLSDMKKGIHSYVSNEAKKQERELLEWKSYSFQYIGVQDKSNKYVLINALCSRKDIIELQSFTLTNDGGNCYFSLSYEPNKKKFYNFFINAPI